MFVRALPDGVRREAGREDGGNVGNGGGGIGADTKRGEFPSAPKSSASGITQSGARDIALRDD